METSNIDVEKLQRPGESVARRSGCGIHRHMRQMLTNPFYHPASEYGRQTPLQTTVITPILSLPLEYTTPVIRFINPKTFTHFITRVRRISHPRSITHRLITFWEPRMLSPGVWLYTVSCARYCTSRFMNTRSIGTPVFPLFKLRHPRDSGKQHLEGEPCITNITMY